MFNWFGSKAARTARDMCKHARKVLSAQRDILTPQAIVAMEKAVSETQKAIAERASKEDLKKRMADLEAAANKWLKSYPNAAMRENFEVLLVALAVAMGIRTFFVQPFKIPTGSMQPTLFGVVPSPVPGLNRNDPDLKIPGTIPRFFDFWKNGNSYYNEIAPTDGRLTAIKPPVRFLLFNLWQEYQFNNEWRKIWFPADELFQRAGYIIDEGRFRVSPSFKAGDTIIRMKVRSGDHVFVDRLSYNFRPPKRGEIIVFETRGIGPLPQDQFYIKRLVGLPREKLRIGDDRHLVVDGVRLDSNTPHFEKVYGFNPSDPPRDSQYSGHVNRHEYFPNGGSEFTVHDNHFVVMGDNTMSSDDSRRWGDFPRTNVIGKYFFVYWPFSERFGVKVR